MKKQVIRLLCCVAVCAASSSAMAGECGLFRMYKDGGNIMRHFSTQPLPSGAGSKAQCSSACRDEALIVSEADANALKAKGGAAKAVVRCTFNGGEKGEVGATTLAESTVAIGQLRLKAAKSARAASTPTVARPTTGRTPETSAVKKPTIPAKPAVAAPMKVQQQPATKQQVPAPATTASPAPVQKSYDTPQRSPSYDYKSPHDKPYVSPYDRSTR
jgi:hypothetical protein